MHRAKQHQVENFKNSTKCLKCPEHVREELAWYMAEKKSDKENYDKMPDFDDIDNMIEIEDVDDDEVEEVEVIQKGKKSCSSKRGVGSSTQVKTVKLMLKSKNLKRSHGFFCNIKARKSGCT